MKKLKEHTSHPKPQMHPRNLHNQGYDFVKLCCTHPPLKAFLAPNPVGKLTIDFSQPRAVKSLNAALLKHYYGITHWDIPDGFLCPAVPGRADYVHYIADLLTGPSCGEKSKANQIKGIDIGTGANLIYPIIASQSYAWQMVGTDVNPSSLASAKEILASNPELRTLISLREQKNSSAIFDGIIREDEVYDFSMCNPPFHISAEAAIAGSRKKNKNLAKHSVKRRGNHSSAINQSLLNFGGQSNELWCNGGEFAFVKQMLTQSVKYKSQVRWFTSLLSKKDSVEPLLALAKQLNAVECKSVNMSRGAKVSRFIAWRFM